MKPNQRLVNFLGTLWLLCCCTLLRAAPAFSDDVRGYDYESLAFGMAAALLGGAARTILSLASDKLVVLSLLREMRKDAIVAMVGGGMAYVALQALVVTWPAIFNSEMRMLVLLGIGFSRGKWQMAIGRLSEDGFANLRARVRGSSLPDDVPPSSSRIPLEPEK